MVLSDISEVIEVALFNRELVLAELMRSRAESTITVKIKEVKVNKEFCY